METKMELYELNAVRQVEDTELDAIAAMIRPLPKSVVPSAKFVDQTRRVLLKLDGRRAQAA
jgi:hypothetical protein